MELNKEQEVYVQELKEKLAFFAELTNTLKLFTDVLTESMVERLSQTVEYIIEAGEVLSSKNTLSLLKALDKNSAKLEKLLVTFSQIDDRVIDNLFDLINLAVLMTDTLTEDMIDRNVKIISRLGEILEKFTHEENYQKLEMLLGIFNKLDLSTIELLGKKADVLNSPEFGEILESVTDKQTLKLASAATRSLAKTDFSSPSTRFSLFRAIKIMKKPGVRKTLGALVDMAEEFQKNLK